MKRLLLILLLCCGSLAGFSQSYCTPSFSYAYGSCTSYYICIQSFNAVGVSSSISDGNSCDGSGYLDRTSLSCTMYMGGTYAVTVQTGPYYSMSGQIWIDFNYDGTFDASERVGGFASGTGAHTFNITLAGGVYPGTRRMRVATNDANYGGAHDPSISPCGGYYYGEDRDYMIDVSNPPPTASWTPSSYGFGSVTASTTSGTANLVLDAAYLSTSTGNLTVSSSSSDFQVYNGSSWASSYTISFSGSGVSGVSVPIRFNAPSSAGSYSTSLCVSGGGLSSAVCATVTGTSAAGCSGTPSAGSAAVSPTTGSSGTTFTLSLSGASSTGGLSYQWQSSPNNTTWTNITGATTASYSYTSGITANTYFRCIVTCAASSSSANSSSALATWVLPASGCASTPAFANACSSYPMTTAILSLVGGSGTLSDNTACTASSYEDYSASRGCTLYRSLSYTATMNISSTYYGSFGYQFWIDFNDNGLFESTESMGGANYPGSPNPTMSISVPGSAALGMHRARVVGNYQCCGASTYPSMNPCPTTSISYGDCRDYYIIIQDPPPMASVAPTSISYGTIATSGTSSTQNIVLNASFLSPSSGNLTVTASTNFSVYNGSSWVSSYTISYSSSAVSGVTIPTQFNAPSTSGVYSGTICVSGGGLASSVCTSVSGTSANACSGTPTAGTLSVSPAAGTSATTFSFSLSGGSIGLGLSYQWQSSTSVSGTYSNISGATNPTYSVTGLSSTLYYKCVVSCSYSGLNATSNIVPTPIYCLPAFANACSSYPMNASIGNLVGVSGSISDATACGSSSYEDRTSLSCTVTAGVTYTCTLNLTTSYYSSFSVQVWIDYNNDGTFSSTESIGGGSGFSSPTASTISMAIPTTATVGAHRMRLVGNYMACCGGLTYPSMTPCPTTSISYGDARDYMITIAPPPPAATVAPTSIAFSPTTTGSSSATSNITLNASYLTPTSGSLTVTGSGAPFEIYDGSSWITGSYTISYSGATVTANTIQVRFTPSSAGSFSGTVCVSGGGLASSVCTSLTGTGATACSGTPTAGTASVSPTSGSTGTTFVASVTGYTASGGIGFQWQSRNPSGSGSFTNVSGATLSSYSFSGMSSSTDLRCIVTCSISGLSATTSAVTATWVLPASGCSTTPTFANPCSSYPMTTAILSLVGGSGTLSDNTACNSSSYEDYSASRGCTLFRSLSYTATMNISSSYYSSFSYQFWIDFNDNGLFESTESMGGANNPTSVNPTMAFSIPGSAAVGMHRARVVGNYGCCGYSTYPTVNPCPTSSISYGDCRDYFIVITDPPPYGSTAPTSLNFGTIATSSTSSALYTLLSAAYLTPASGSLTVNASTNYLVSGTSGGSYANSYTLSYSASTVTANSVWVKFVGPATAGTYTGNVAVTGGGLGSAINTAVTGISANACSGTPSTGTASSSPSAGTSATTFNLSLSGTSIGLGLSYQWYVSTTGTSGWSSISGETNPTLTVSGLTSARYYECIVTCSYSSTSSTSNVVGIPIYCVPAFANSCPSFPMNASIGNLVGVSGSISDATACGSSSYEDRTSLSCTLTAGATYTCTLNLTASYYNSFSVQVWIDYNNDGTFSSTESIGGGSSFSSATTSTISMAIPTTATVGAHRMRLVGNYMACCGGLTYPSMTPCPTTAISYGDARDYTITIAPPPPAATVAPTSIAFSPTTTGSSSATSNITLNASYLSPTSGSLTVTGSGAPFEIYNGSSWITGSYTISYSGATVTANTIQVRFTPSSAGSFSGTVCVSGGGLASSVCTSLTGTGATACSGTPTSGTASVSPTSGSTGTTFVASVTGYTASGGIGFQWQSRNPSGSGSFTDVSGATLATYSFSGMTSSTDLRCIVTCSYSGLTATTSAVTATWVLAASACSTTPTFGNPCSSYPMTTGILNLVGGSGTLSDNTACGSSSYEDYSASRGCTLYRSLSYTATMNISSSYYSSFGYQFWIDFNDNGLFESSESMGGGNSASSANPTMTFSIPGGAALGMHRARTVGNYAVCCGGAYYPSINPCPTTSISYGDCRDYYIIIASPPPMASVSPTTLSFGTIAASSTSSTMNTTLTASFLTPSSSSLTVTASTTEFSVYNGSSWVQSYTISYSSSTVAATTIPVRFNAPSTTGAYSGTICVSGGGLASSVCASVSGTSATACSGTPSAGTTVASPAAGSSATTFNLSLSGSSIGLGLTYQWMQSTTGSSGWSNISGATNATYSFSGLTSTMYYYCLVTCTYSGLNQYSSVQRVSYYCTPTFANACSSFPMNASISNLVGTSGSITDASSCTGSSYEDMTSLSCALTAGVNYTTTLNLSCSYYSSFSLQVWIDYNDDGTYSSSESVGGGGGFSSCTASTIVLSIPSTATVGTHRMRLVNNYQCCGGAAYPSINPCPTTSISYGDARDYTVNILPPPPVATVSPTSIAFSPTTTGTSSATSNIILNATYLSPTSGNLTVTGSGAPFEIYNGSSWITGSYTISYSGATVSANTIQVRFSPSSAGSFSGSVCVSGGGLASAVCASLNGTGASPCSGTPTAGSAAVSPTTGSGGTSFTLTCTGYSASGGIGFQWQSSPDNSTWSNISGATLASYGFTGISVNTYYRCIVSCSYSGLTATTSSVLATWTLPASSCTPTFGSASASCSSYAMWINFSLVGTSGSIADASSCTGSGWEDLTGSTSVGLLRGNTFTATVTTGGTYYSSMASQVWIDYNDDGSFASTESVGGYNYYASTAQNISLTIPSTATPGIHRMRIVQNYASCCGGLTYPSMNPCPTSGISYGDCRDYKVTIIAPVACSGTPSSGGVTASPSTGCSPVSTSMYPSAAVGVTGLTYQWQSSSTSTGTYTAISGATSFTYAPTVSSNTYYNCVLTCTASGGSATTASQLITANQPGGTFSGTTNACVGSSSALSNAVSGGTWSSSNTSIATVIPSTGVVYGVAPGGCTINYTTSGCSAVGTSWTTNANPGSTSGTANACEGGTRVLTNTIPGGTWSSSDTTIAQVATTTSTTGTVSARVAGSCTISYSTGCGTPTTTSWTTFTTPSAIIGLSSVCTASVNNFSNTVTGGTWSVTGSATGTTIDASTGDLYTATTVGTETVTYTIGSCFVTMSVGVGSSGPSTISGATSVCAGANTTLSNSVTPGVWTSSTPSIASIGFTSGVVTGVTSGSVTITYSTGCGTPVTASMTVNGSLVTITAPTVCSGSTLTMTANSGAGSYSYSWSGPLGFTSGSAAPSISSATTSRSGIYSLTATQSGCSSSTSYWVSVDSMPQVSVSATPASICPGGSSNLQVTVNTPAAGTTNYAVMAIPYAPYTIPSPSAGPSGDDVSSTVGIPFSFNYYGTSYSSISICTNGYICIGGSSTSYTPYNVPSASNPAGMVALFMHDFNGSGITYGTVGTSPNRKFVVRWNAYGDYSGGGVNSGQVALYETSNIIEMFITQSNTNSSYSQICGIQNPSGSLGVTVPGQNNTNFTINNTVAGTGWRFERPVYSYTWSPATGLSASNIYNPVASGLGSTMVYTVTSVDANSGCTAGNATPNTVNVYTPATVYTVSPTTGCTSGTTISLPNSQTGVTYQLFNGSTAIGSPVSGSTGSSISFPSVSTVGTYSVVATLTTGGCTTNMAGTCVVYTSPTAYTVTGGTGCSYAGVTIGLSGSETTASYQLYVGSTPVGSPITGTGSPFTFPTAYGAGAYTVIATGTTGGCQTTQTGSATIAVSPVAYNVTGGNGCSGAGVAVGTSNSETGASYQMYIGGSATGSPASGSTGTPVTFGTQYTPGVYTIVATAGGCSTPQTGADTISTTPAISLGANPSVCQPVSSASIGFSSPSGSPTTYNITWGSTALADGFSNVSGATLTGSSISLSIPTGVANTYTGTITVSNGPCTSSAYSFTLTVYAQPAGSITSAVVPCSGYSTNVVITGTPGATVAYKINHGSTLTGTISGGGTYTYSTGVITTAVVFTLVDIHNPVCTQSYDIDTTINPTPMTWIGGTSGFETEWNYASNWSCGFIPTAIDNVTIPSGTTYSPVIATSASGTTNDIAIAAGATVTVSTGGNLNVKGTIANNGTVTGAGSAVMNGSASQGMSGVGFYKNLEINNVAGVAVSSGSTVYLKGVLTMSAGTLATGDSVVFWSDTFGTARLAQMPTSGTAISGNVRVMQWIPTGRRAYRFWAHPFSTNTGLSQVETVMPYVGGIDVTGAGGTTNGFTYTASNAPSAFRYNPAVGNSALGSDPGWRAFTSAYVTAADSNRLHQYQGVRLYFRGAKGEGLGYAPYVPSQTTVAQWGVLNQHDQTIPLVKGTSANQDYNMVGNPFASPVDIGTIVYNAKTAGALTGTAYYVWNAYAGTVGQFQPQTIPTASATPYYLQANACFQVRTAYNGATMTFAESNKGTTPNTVVLKTEPQYSTISIYDGSYHYWDQALFQFNDNATTGDDADYDAVKPSGPADLNFYALSSDNKKMGVDGRPYDANAIIPLGIQSNVAQDFIIKADNIAVPEGGKLYLHDKLLKQYVLLQTGTEYRFTISADMHTQGENRFELTMAPAKSATKGLKVTMNPNPTTDEVNISFVNAKAETVSVRILDIAGVSVYNQNLGVQQNGNVRVHMSDFAAGVYMVELTSGDQKVVQRLVKE